MRMEREEEEEGGKEEEEEGEEEEGRQEEEEEDYDDAQASVLPPSVLSRAQLMSEKKRLHTLLKAYERSFEEQQGRRVTQPEDITPVRVEFERYNSVKEILGSMRKS